MITGWRRREEAGSRTNNPKTKAEGFTSGTGSGFPSLRQHRTIHGTHLACIIFRHIARSREIKGRVLCIIDDNPNKRGRFPDGVFRFMTGAVRVSETRDVAIEDLPGRDPIHVEMEEIYASLSILLGHYEIITGDYHWIPIGSYTHFRAIQAYRYHFL